ncbi:MAG: nucleoside phosphorylase [Desulfobulbaceae bacterium]|nr:nucleoside phosphorylase [Desulfobulbaceae bacterium]HIJ90287.1 nucleoside phosphorylase [Deltaproteobacteria bacterium]
MSEVVVHPSRGKNEPQLPACGVLLVNPSEACHAARIFGQEGWSRHFLFHSNLYLAQTSPAIFWAGPAVGAPMAVICLEKLIALGAGRIIVCGWCGSLQPNLGLGELVLPTWAISEEGTSDHYPLTGVIESSPRLRKALKDFFVDTGKELREGPLWTTDALYRETREKVVRYGGEGILAVDMEYSALIQVAAFRQVELAAVMMVSDLLWQDSWQPAFQSKEFRKRSHGLVADLVRCVGALAAE